MLMKKSLNERIIDRSDVFYWQAERRITEDEARAIWTDKDSQIKNEVLIKQVNKVLPSGNKCVSIDNVDPNSQESCGGVNSTRVAHLQSGEDVLVRCHPIGVRNGYFYVESLAADLLIKNNLPSYKTYAIKDFNSKKDCAFQVIEKINGTVVSKFLKQHPEKENQLVFEMGKVIAKANKIKVDGFGPFDNELAKKGILKGVHKTYADFMNAGLDFDLKTLKDYGLLSEEQTTKIKNLFNKNNPLLKCKQATFVHNDFADWNMLTDGKTINGIIDVDECVGGDFMCEIACWSLFFKPERLAEFLKGYFTVVKKPKNFEDKLEILRLRYSLSKMTLRIRRYTYDKDIKALIDIGKIHLQKSAEYFKVW